MLPGDARIGSHFGRESTCLLRGQPCISKILEYSDSASACTGKSIVCPRWQEIPEKIHCPYRPSWPVRNLRTVSEIPHNGQVRLVHERLEDSFECSRSYPVVNVSKCVFVGVSRFSRSRACVFFFEVSFIPELHCGHGMVRGCQRFLSPNSLHPVVDGLLVC